jgi:hypothetical protein
MHWEIGMCIMELGELRVPPVDEERTSAAVYGVLLHSRSFRILRRNADKYIELETFRGSRPLNNKI